MANSKSTKIPRISEEEIPLLGQPYGSRYLFHYTQGPIELFEERGVWSGTYALSYFEFDPRSAAEVLGLKAVPDKVLVIRNNDQAFKRQFGGHWVSEKLLPPTVVRAYAELTTEFENPENGVNPVMDL